MGKKTVLVTGHSGFTGSWATKLLQRRGYTVFGLSLSSPHNQDLTHIFDSSHIEKAFDCDIANSVAVEEIVKEVRPELIMHLAAQPLVSKSYDFPLETFSVNAMGTANILEAARLCEQVRGVLAITTDKVYLNRNWPWPYRESDHLGGSDPYSASKSAAEMAIASYQSSFGMGSSRGMLIASVRGGNIIGGGDWSSKRIVPDFARSRMVGQALELRNPVATRPWQHVLDLVQAYVLILDEIHKMNDKVEGHWNIGPTSSNSLTVFELVTLLGEIWPGPSPVQGPKEFHEFDLLSLDSSKARSELGWSSIWGPEKAIEKAGQWYFDNCVLGKDANTLMERDIDEFERSIG